jgi:hypothetical protein
MKGRGSSAAEGIGGSMRPARPRTTGELLCDVRFQKSCRQFGAIANPIATTLEWSPIIAALSRQCRDMQKSAIIQMFFGKIFLDHRNFGVILSPDSVAQARP